MRSCQLAAPQGSLSGPTSKGSTPSAYLFVSSHAPSGSRQLHAPALPGSPALPARIQPSSKQRPGEAPDEHRPALRRAALAVRMAWDSQQRTRQVQSPIRNEESRDGSPPDGSPPDGSAVDPAGKHVRETAARPGRTRRPHRSGSSSCTAGRWCALPPTLHRRGTGHGQHPTERPDGQRGINSMAEIQRDAFAQPAGSPGGSTCGRPDSVRRRKKLRHARHRCRQRSTSGERRPSASYPCHLADL